MKARTLFRHVCSLVSVFVLGLGVLEAPSARAGALDWATGPSIHDAPGERDWGVSVTPYLWLADASGDLTTPSGQTGSGSTTFQGYSSKIEIGIEGVIDIRWRRWHVISDGTWLELSSSQLLTPPTPGPGNPSFDVSVDSTMAFGTAGVAYELPLEWSTAVDLYLAARWWHFTSDVTTTSGPFVAFASSKTVWADVVGGFRLRHDITDHWKVGFGADVGGGGSDLTWQTYGTLRYMINRHFGIVVGYRVLGVDYSSGGYRIDLTERGLTLGVEFAI